MAISGTIPQPFYSPTHPDYASPTSTCGSRCRALSSTGQGLPRADCFRIGNIGDVTPERVRDLLAAMASACYWQGDAMTSMLAQGRICVAAIYDHKLPLQRPCRQLEGDINLGEGRARWWAGQSEAVQAGLAEDSRYAFSIRRSPLLSRSA